MNKFKFGDKVIHREYGIGIVVKEVTLHNNVPVIFDGDFNVRWIASYDLNCILHYDTVRLDFLIKNGAYIETVDGTYGFYVGEEDDICGNKSRISEVLDTAIHKRINKMKVKEEHLVGKIADFPLHIVQAMVDEQVRQGKPADPSIFAEDLWVGFNWSNSEQGREFWEKVIICRNFDFYSRK